MTSKGKIILHFSKERVHRKGTMGWGEGSEVREPTLQAQYVSSNLQSPSKNPDMAVPTYNPSTAEGDTEVGDGWSLRVGSPASGTPSVRDPVSRQ